MVGCSYSPSNGVRVFVEAERLAGSLGGISMTDANDIITSTEELDAIADCYPEYTFQPTEQKAMQGWDILRNERVIGYIYGDGSEMANGIANEIDDKLNTDIPRLIATIRALWAERQDDAATEIDARGDDVRALLGYVKHPPHCQLENVWRDDAVCTCGLGGIVEAISAHYDEGGG
jgi:hypothetical protein